MITKVFSKTQSQKKAERTLGHENFKKNLMLSQTFDNDSNAAEPLKSGGRN